MSESPAANQKALSSSPTRGAKQSDDELSGLLVNGAAAWTCWKWPILREGGSLKLARTAGGCDRHAEGTKTVTSSGCPASPLLPVGTPFGCLIRPIGADCILLMHDDGRGM